jgi:hypothetical protein
MARATYIYLVHLDNDTVIPYTVKWEMIQDIRVRELAVREVVRAKDGQPGYAQQVMPESEWRPDA